MVLLLRVSFLTRINLCQNTDMSQDDVGVDLETSLGYLLKEASSALRAAMEEVLRPLGMSVTHYSCLELLAQRPGLSNSELARGAFVTRQSMNVLLQALERDGYVTRPAEAPVGKVLPDPAHAPRPTEPGEGDRGGPVRRGQDAGRHDRGRAVRRVPDPAEHDPLPARWRRRLIPSLRYAVPIAFGDAALCTLVGVKTYTLLDRDGRPYQSDTPAPWAGTGASKIYGRLDCPSALRWIAKGQYVQHRVFFADEQVAVAAGYGPAAIASGRSTAGGSRARSRRPGPAGRRR